MSARGFHRPRWVKKIAAGAAGALGVATLSVLAATPAQATVTGSTDDATLTWGFSVYSQSWGASSTGNVDLINVTTKTGPGASGVDYLASEGFTLTDGEGSIGADGTGEIDFTGSVTYRPFEGYGPSVDTQSVTFADFELEVTSGTRGSLSALVSYTKPNSSVAPTRVTVANFDIDSVSLTDGEFLLDTAAPDWTDVVPAGTYNGSYTDSWPTELVDLLRTGVETGQDINVYFYRTGTSGANNNKAPLEITASADTATPEVTATVQTATSSYANGLKVDVAGDGFRAVTNPGDAGVYVGIAEAGGLPDVSSPAGAASFVAQGYLTPGALATGSFSTVLTADTDTLDSTKSYSVYTWQAHTHSNTTQDTETPLTINWGLLTEPGEVTVSTTSASYADGLNLSVAGTGFRAVTLPGDAGVYVGVAEAGGLPDVSSPGGAASFVATAYLNPGVLATGSFTRAINVPTAKLDRTKSYSVYTWQAHTHSNLSQDTETAIDVDFDALTLATETTVSGSLTGVFGKTRTLTAAVAGEGTVTVTGLGLDQVITAEDGTASITVPGDLAVGTHDVTVAYSGDGQFVGASSTQVAVVVKKASTNANLIWIKKPVVGKKARLRVAVTSKAAEPTGSVTVVLERGKKKVKLSAKALAGGKAVFIVTKAQSKTLGKGLWDVSATYGGDASYKKTTFLDTIRVKK